MIEKLTSQVIPLVMNDAQFVIHLLAGEYGRAILTGHFALKMNGSYEGVHEYVAWSFQALEKWNEAVAMLKRAVR